jgi:hypothetical protein
MGQMTRICTTRPPNLDYDGPRTFLPFEARWSGTCVTRWTVQDNMMKLLVADEYGESYPCSELEDRRAARFYRKQSASDRRLLVRGMISGRGIRLFTRC